ncbi:MAG: hypothetical protein HKN12_10100, partial [Gemmatimonadetes bacterium]|nr:hypothetical protein [Gemmatimonadota bacterium]
MRRFSIRTALMVAVAVLGLGLTAGCGEPADRDGSGGGQAAEYRSRAEKLEESGDLAAAHGAYRDAVRRFPT